MTGIPAHEAPIWIDGKCTNKGDLPLWSGKGPVPEVGARVQLDGKRPDFVTVTGYKVQDGWLMLLGTRESDGKRGDLAGAEILWREPE